jgi:hypothetical protein
MHQQLWGYNVEEKLYVGVREKNKRLNTTVLEDQVSNPILEFGYPGGFLCFIYVVKANICTVPQIKPRWLPHTSFPIHFVLVVLPFNDIQSKLQGVSLWKPSMKNYFKVYTTSCNSNFNLCKSYLFVRNVLIIFYP